MSNKYTYISLPDNFNPTYGHEIRPKAGDAVALMMEGFVGYRKRSDVRKTSEADIKLIEIFDRAIEALQKERVELLKAAFERGKAI